MKAKFFRLISLTTTLTILLAPFTATVGAASALSPIPPVPQSQGTNQAASVLPVWAQPPAAVAQPATFYKVIAQPGVLDVSQEGITLWHDYGAFALYKVSAATLNQLSSATRSKIQVATDMDYIMLDAYPFDTQTDTFDAIPEPFRVTQPDGPALHLIQFVGPIKDAWLQAIKEAGATTIFHSCDVQDVHLVLVHTTSQFLLNIQVEYRGGSAVLLCLPADSCASGVRSDEIIPGSHPAARTWGRRSCSRSARPCHTRPPRSTSRIPATET